MTPAQISMQSLTNPGSVPLPVDEHVEETRDSLRRHYFADQRAWVVAYSGGKDSTLVLQLVYDLILELGSSARKPSWFRWCTTKMKIKPSRAVIDGIVRAHGGVVLLLGTRLDESASRAQRMEGRATNSRGLNPHGEIPDTLVMTPIADWSTDQVWEYLFTRNPPPWGGTHDFMLDLYRQASGGECPVVFDLNTPSCGGSRFGCWTCTVVKEDKSMRGFIDSGAAWMQPLNEFRNWLKAIREDTSKRDGIRRNESIGPGPFSSETCKLIRAVAPRSPALAQARGLGAGAVLIVVPATRKPGEVFRVS